MSATPQAFNHQATSDCEICGAQIPFLETLKNKDRSLPICGAIECENVLKQKARMPEASFKVYLASHQRVLSQRKQRIAVKEEIRKQEAEEHQQIFEHMSRLLKGSNQQPSHRVVIPSGQLELVPVDQSRIDLYRSHLESVIDEALEYENVSQAPDDHNQHAHQKLNDQQALFERRPDVKAISDNLCMLCKGGCCSKGENHAYLSASSMRRQLDSNPGWTKEDLLEQYLSRLAPSSSKNACINQGNEGCVLPRELRSSTCNYFFCSSITHYQKLAEEKNLHAPVLAIQRHHTLWNRNYDNAPNDITNVTLVSEMDTHDLDVPDEFKAPRA
ncbi:MAG: hypothetical protein MI867_18620 [Pseudomonadales bacterium]|nr:hypothetical protein [Pseudomonadales bacterium]